MLGCPQLGLKREAGAHTLMELSVGGDLDRVRREVLAAVDRPVGNVPLYQAFAEAGQFAQALFPEDAKTIRNDRSPSCDASVCTMCGDFCANKASSALFSSALLDSAKA